LQYNFSLRNANPFLLALSILHVGHSGFPDVDHICSSL
jgi:hypothetical protein